MRFFERHMQELADEMAKMDIAHSRRFVPMRDDQKGHLRGNPKQPYECPAEYIAYVCDRLLHRHFGSRMAGMDRRALAGLMDLLFDEASEINQLKIDNMESILAPHGGMRRRLTFCIELDESALIHRRHREDINKHMVIGRDEFALPKISESTFRNEYLGEWYDKDEQKERKPAPPPPPKPKPKTQREIALEELAELGAKDEE